MEEKNLIQAENHLQEMIYFIKRKITSISLIAFVLTIFVGAYVFIAIDDTYSANSSMLVEVSEIESDYTKLSISKQLVDTYELFATSSTVLEQVIADLELDMSVSELKNMLTVSSSSGAVIINFVVNYTDPTIATAIVNSIMDTINDLDKSLIGTNSISVLDYAQVPIEANNSNKIIYMILGVVISLIIALAVVYIYNLLNDKVETDEQVEKILGINLLGKILDYKYTKDKNIIDGTYQIMTKIQPDSFISEEYHRMRSKIDLFGIDKEMKVINIVSANPREGKTLTALNLAQVYAEGKAKTLLIDLDLFKSKMNQAYQIPKKEGLSDYFLNEASIENYLTNVQENLDVLQGGSLVSVVEEVLVSNRFKQLMNELKNQYDKIIIDCPPLNQRLEGKLISLHSDGTLFIIGSKMTVIENAKKIIDDMKEMNINIIGGVITNVKMADVRAVEKNYYGAE